jgi:hypothetical protein
LGKNNAPAQHRLKATQYDRKETKRNLKWKELTMVTKSEAFPSRFYKAAEIPDQGLPLKIAKLEQEKVGPDQDLKWEAFPT